jgi:uncharacterized membrane protein (DUF106 family)
MMQDERDELIGLLKQIRDNQEKQLAQQREMVDLYRRQYERAEKLQERAESLQDRSAGMIATARKVMFIVLPIIILLIVYLSFLLFR